MMSMRVLIFSFLFVAGQGLQTAKNPIQKVIELIEELRDKTIADGKAEELVYNRMACWCETTTKSKAGEIKKCQESLSQLSQDINSNKGSIAQLASDIHDLMTDISNNEAKQYMETTKRERQNADYMQNKAELTNAIVALDKALQMLSGVDHLALIQGKAKLSTSAMAAVRAVKPAVLSAIQRLPTDTAEKIPVHKLSALERLGQRFNNKYSPFEPTITQILKDLLESFKATQETETTNEAECQKSYEEIMASKANELATKKQMLADKEEAKAKQNKDEAANQAQWQITADQLTAANKVFVAAKASCTKLANMWDERKKLRDEELKGIKEALKTLTSDDARALIGKAAADGPGKLDFMQVGLVTDSNAMQAPKKAYMALRKAASKSHNLRIATVAALIMEKMQSGKNDEWKTDILSKIDSILTQLSTDQETDTMTYDNCKEEEHQLYLEIENRTGEIKRYNWKISVLDRKIENLEEKIADAVENVESILEMQAKLLSERNAEKSEYEAEKSDDEAAIGVLETAIGQLSKFYKKQGVDLGKLNEADGKFLQLDDKADDIFLQTSKLTMLSKEPVFKKTDHEVIDGMNSFEFSDKGSRGQQSKGIIGLLTVIKEDLASDIEKATSMENDAQADYDGIKKDTDGELSDLRKKIDDYKDDKSDKEGDVSDNEKWKKTETDDLNSAKDELKTMMESGDEGKSISFPCEFMMAEYHNRRVRREAETEGLKQAVAFLEGMQ